MPSGINRTQDV